MKIEKAFRITKKFEAGSLTDKLSSLEMRFQGLNKAGSERIFNESDLDPLLLTSAFEIKKLASQIHVLIHSVGILASLPHILNDDEYIEYLSLGAGNTGRKFDLETDTRIAEFKFISWQGGAESYRQNSIFKDFYELAEEQTDKERFLYVLDEDVPLRFFNRKRKIKSVLSKNNKLSSEFATKYGDRFTVVRDYYLYRKNLVQIVDISSIFTKLGLDTRH